MSPAEVALPRDQIRFRRGGPLLVQLIGLAMSIGGIWVITIMMLAGRHDENTLGICAALSGFLVAPGLLMVFGRAGVVIDRQQQVVVTWRGLTLLWLLDLPVRRKRHLLQQLHAVSLEKEIWYRGDRGGGTTVFVTYLEVWRGEMGERPADLEPSDRLLVKGYLRYRAARRFAETLAKDLDMGMVDATSWGNDARYRPAGTLDEPYSWRAEWSEELIALPEPPRDLRTGYRVVDGRGVFEIPPRGPGRIAVLLVFGLLAVAAAFALRQGAPLLAVVIVSGVIVLPLFFFWLAPTLVWDRLTVSPDGLELRRRSLLGWRRIEISGDQLEELSLGAPTILSLAGISYSGQVIGARSDRQIFEIGAGLGREELSWLLETIRNHLLGLA